MKAMSLSGWGPIVTAFTIWLVHFMLCWAVAEIWPHQWRANVLAWAFTVVALLAMGMHFLRVKAQRADGGLSGFNCRYAHRAIGIATVAVLFSALPSIVFLP